MIGFGFSVFTQAILGLGGGFRGSALNLDFTSGNRTLDPRITFSRTTNATLTNSAGLVANAPMNLLTFSEQFDNAAWVRNGVAAFGSGSVSNTLISPDGSLTADKIASTADNARHEIYRGVITVTAGTSYTFSFYAKAAEYSFVQAMFSVSGFTGLEFVNVNLSTGAVGTVGSGVTASSVTAVGNGWFRISMTAVASSSVSNASADIVLSNSESFGRGGAFLGDGTSGIYVWGAQLELGSTATTYNPTTVKNLLGFTEHFDNAAWTKSNAFVQTNLLTYSQDFDNASWNKQGVTVAANTHIAPDGTTTAEKIAETATTDTHVVVQTYTALSSAYTASVFVKADERGFALFTNGTAVGISVDLSTGVATSAVGSPTNINSTNAGNGWYRVSFTFTPVVGGNNLNIYASTNGVFANRSYAGTTGSGIYLWGAQLVQGTSAGDYKATYAAAAAVGYTDIYGQPFAQKLVENTATAEHRVQVNITFSAAPFTASAYFKAAERSFAFIRLDDSGSAKYAYFNLATGTVGTVTSGLTAFIESIGDGWYRCAARFNTPAAGSGTVIFAPTTANGTNSYTGDGTSGIYIFGAQLSDSASVDPYVYNPVAAPSSVAYYGPRFDYDPVTLAPKGLLIEEQRTNLLTYSEQFDNAAKSKTATTVTANSTVAPDGTLTADTLIETTATSGHVVSTSATVGAIANVLSVYFKKGLEATAPDWIQLYTGGVSLQYANFNLATGSVGNVAAGSTATITPTGNGWYRCTLTFTPSSAGSVAAVIAFTNNTDTTTRGLSYAGADTSDVFVWGAQLEAGAFATSYIPTAASQVTRAADSASMIGNNFARWFNQNAGTLYGEVLFNTSAGFFQCPYSVNDGTNNNRIQPYQNSSLTSVGFDVTTGLVAQAAVTITVPNITTSAVKQAGAYQTNDINNAANGAVGTADTSATLASYTQLLLGRNQSNSTPFNGTIKRIAYYNRRLSNTELQGITS